MKTLTLSLTADDSKKINDVNGPCVVIAGSGMCNGGRILHHLKANLWKADTHVVVVGYQSHGTPGRLLVDGAEKIKLFGEEIAVRGTVHTLGGFSAHAGQTDLMTWLEKLVPQKPRVALTHGENGPRGTLASLIRERFDLAVQTPGLKEPITV